MRSRARVLLPLVVLLVAGCSAPTGPSTTSTLTPPTHPTTDGHPLVELFDGSRALALATAQVVAPNGSIRYRVPGTVGNDEAARLIVDELAARGIAARYDFFNATYGCNRTTMHNVVGVLPGSTNVTWILGAHYDTRPIAESDASPANRGRPIPGANDGGSGVGVLLELARVLPRTLSASVAFVFFDGEDGGGWQGTSLTDYSCTDWLLGSTHYAKAMTNESVRTTRGMILVDLVGDPGMRLPREAISTNVQNLPQTTRLWATAAGLHMGAFVNVTSWGITDDHVPFSERGIPATDIIDLRDTNDTAHLFPPTHHTQSDDVAHLSAASMQAVGRVLEQFLIDSG
ncbi:MAG: M28 family peptidase [Thermoplasmatota archaeon]